MNVLYRLDASGPKPWQEAYKPLGIIG